MASIDPFHATESPAALTLPAGLDVPGAWAAVAAAVQAFIATEGARPSDVVVLLPFAQHLPLARAAWAARCPSAWMPRFETTQTLLLSLPPGAPPAEGAPSFDAVADRLQAAALLRAQVPDWPRRDARGFALAAARVAETAQALARVRLALPPARRAAWLDEARARLGPLQGVGAEERSLARLALEWSAGADADRVDALFTLALDRVLVRRVRALLERQAVALADETGWKLSTTRAGAGVVGLLRAVQPRASTDELLEWLKSASQTPSSGLDALEARWRRDAVRALARVDEVRLDGEALALWRDWLAQTEPLRGAGRRPLADWLARLGDVLQRTGRWTVLDADPAGAQVIDALRCRSAAPAWPQAVLATVLDAAGFLAWVDEVLEQVAYQPPAVEGAAVVVTPLARAMLRPFAAIVCPGADAARLGAWPAPDPLLGDALAAALGLPGGAERRVAELCAFAQLLRASRLTLLYRQLDGREPQQASPLLRQLRQGGALAAAPDPRPLRTIAPAPVARPAPVAVPALLPDTLDASAYEDLRACPYRYHALRVLGLAEPDELDDEFDKADYGRWLHEVLEAFHARRGGARDREADAALLDAIARERQQALGRDDADFLPYAAWFGRIAPRYLDWLHAEEARGAAVQGTELKLAAQPPELAAQGLSIKGRIDRIDALRTSGALRIVDYKTSSQDRLRQRLRTPSEETQLAFYAALLAAARGRPAGGIEAGYLALDDKKGVALLPHADVETSAARLLDGIAADFERMRAGAALPALGEGEPCEHCRARGLCRRDHWAEGA
jgi:ATP-dependent helicase/nuclease subunit B